jgi:hypothetical protein
VGAFCCDDDGRRTNDSRFDGGEVQLVIRDSDGSYGID